MYMQNRIKHSTSKLSKAKQKLALYIPIYLNKRNILQSRKPSTTNKPYQFV